MFSVQSQVKSPVPLKVLFDSLPEYKEKRDRALKKLFKGNSADFEKFVSQLDTAETWAATLDLIEAEFKNRKIKMDSKEAIGLTDVLFKRFFPSY
ncbi:MAG: hypothetical protein KDC45_01635 [Bacteroidetes bacterium]|nr:hypothetical protein [Bacteroidota bacterium]